MDRSERLPDESVRPAVMEMLTTFSNSAFAGVELHDHTLIPNEVEMAEFPSLEIRIGRARPTQREDSVYLLNRSKC